MEINFTRSRLFQIAALVVLIAAAIFAYQQKLFAPPPAAINLDEYNAQPAIQALAIVYAPSGDQTTWEQTACLNMTSDGCDLFKAYYAPAIWNSKVAGTHARFVELVESAQDGSQVWLTGVTINEQIVPLFIQVQKRADGKWLLARVLFEEEAKKYEK